MLREDAGEIEAAETGTLPRPIGPLCGDFHLHTTVSGDGRSSLEEMVAAAIARGYRVLAVTDHAEGTLSGVDRDAFLAQRERVRAMQAEVGDKLKLLHGVELNIGPAGELDYDLEFRRSFDWCLASVHDHFDLDRAAQTRRIVTAMQDPAVRMIGHPSARMIGGRPPIDLDYDQVFAAAEATGTALEVNGGLPRLDLSVEALRRARGRNVTFLLTSDAHEAGELERVNYATLNAERAWLDRERVANAWDPERLIAWLGRKVAGAPPPITPRRAVQLLPSAIDAPPRARSSRVRGTSHPFSQPPPSAPFPSRTHTTPHSPSHHTQPPHHTSHPSQHTHHTPTHTTPQHTHHHTHHTHTHHTTPTLTPHTLPHTTTHTHPTQHTPTPHTPQHTHITLPTPTNTPHLLPPAPARNPPRARHRQRASPPPTHHTHPPHPYHTTTHQHSPPPPLPPYTNITISPPAPRPHAPPPPTPHHHTQPHPALTPPLTPTTPHNHPFPHTHHTPPPTSHPTPSTPTTPPSHTPPSLHRAAQPRRRPAV